MKGNLKFLLAIIVIALLYTACSGEVKQNVIFPSSTSTFSPRISQTPQSTSKPTITPTTTKTSLKIKTPKPSFTSTFKSTQIPTLDETKTEQKNAEATISAFGTICDLPSPEYKAQISPDGNWIAMLCQGKDRAYDSYLRIVSIQDKKDWIIRLEDYTKGLQYPNIDYLYPFHWSKDGKYLYITAPSLMDGCCWMGDFLLMVRLNLENGQQTEIVNYVSDGYGLEAVDFSISSDDRYVLYIPQKWPTNLYILDTYTWKQRVIELKYDNTGAGETLMSPNGKNIILIIRQYPDEYQGDLTYGSLVLIDLVKGKQRKILSGYEFWDTPQPLTWKDNEHVILCHSLFDCSDNQLLININTGELVNNP